MKDIAKFTLGLIVYLSVLMGGAYIASSHVSVSDRLSLADANVALSTAGGMIGKVFAVGDNRYVVRRSRLIGKKGNVFIGEIEIEPLPKHVGGAR